MGPLFITMTTGPNTFYESEFRICDQHMTMGPLYITITTGPATLNV